MPASEMVERDVRALCDAGDHGGAATVALRGYGPELYSFIAAIHRDDADDVFSEVSARIWRGLPKFGWQSSLRTWAYAIARNASLSARTRGRREVQLGESEADAIAVEVRTATRTYLRTDTKTKFAELRAALPVEDQELLILRVDRGLDWKDLAQALAGDEVSLDDAALRRESARLRKRFQIVKDKLLEAGRAAGLVGTRS